MRSLLRLLVRRQPERATCKPRTQFPANPRSVTRRWNTPKSLKRAKRPYKCRSLTGRGEMEDVEQAFATLQSLLRDR